MDASPVKALNPLIWHIYCTITYRIKIHGAEYGRKSPVTSTRRNGSHSIAKF